jgi:hypothetical protein
MHPVIINRILDLAATKVAAQFDHQAVIDQAADAGTSSGRSSTSSTPMRLPRRPPNA